MSFCVCVCVGGGRTCYNGSHKKTLTQNDTPIHCTHDDEDAHMHVPIIRIEKSSQSSPIQVLCREGGSRSSTSSSPKTQNECTEENRARKTIEDRIRTCCTVVCVDLGLVGESMMEKKKGRDCFFLSKTFQRRE